MTGMGRELVAKAYNSVSTHSGSRLEQPSPTPTPSPTNALSPLWAFLVATKTRSRGLQKLAWYDILPCDKRIQSESPSSTRYILRQMVGDYGEEKAEDQFRECRECGRKLDTQEYCPTCGSDEIAEYETF